MADPALSPPAGPPAAPAAAVLDALAAGRRVGGRTVVVCAHPDDETLGLGGVLRLFDGLELVQVTDGAPLDPADRRAAGCASRAQYAALREREATAALAALGVDAPRTRLGLVDQAAVEALAPLTLRLQALLAGAERVFTHAYEGGHPDHDSSAFAVQAACRRLAAAGGRAPLRCEFAGYHAGPGGERVVGRFWSDPARPERVVKLDASACARKAAAVRAHASQAAVASWFPAGEERLRIAPDYDFAQAPPPGRALYDAWGWSLAGALWRRRATAAEAVLAGAGGA